MSAIMFEKQRVGKVTAVQVIQGMQIPGSDQAPSKQQHQQFVRVEVSRFTWKQRIQFTLRIQGGNKRAKIMQWGGGGHLTINPVSPEIYSCIWYIPRYFKLDEMNAQIRFRDTLPYPGLPVIAKAASHTDVHLTFFLPEKFRYLDVRRKFTKLATRLFPKLGEGFKIIGAPDTSYRCIGHSMGRRTYVELDEVQLLNTTNSETLKKICRDIALDAAIKKYQAHGFQPLGGYKPPKYLNYTIQVPAGFIAVQFPTEAIPTIYTRHYGNVQPKDYEFAPGKQKVVLYENEYKVTGNLRLGDGQIVQNASIWIFKVAHATLQDEFGTWESKIGKACLIRHKSPDDLRGSGEKSYGRPAVVLVRKLDADYKRNKWWEE